MKTSKHTPPQESNPESSAWLDKYPLEVLQQVLMILQAQRDEAQISAQPVKLTPSSATTESNSSRSPQHKRRADNIHSG